MKNQLQYLTLVVSVLSVLMALPIKAQINKDFVDTKVLQDNQKISQEGLQTVSRLNDIKTPVTTVGEWLAQMETAIEVTRVRLDSTEMGLRIVLETAEGELSAPTTQTVGNAVIVEIPNAVLSLPEGDSFEQFDPIDGIALVRVSTMGSDRIQVAITGSNAPPSASVSSENGNLVWTVIPSIAQQVDDTDEDAIEIVVTGEEEKGYAVDEATTATRTDTPLRDIPQSIQVIPRQVLEDQQVIRLEDALRNVSGVAPGDNFGGSRDQFLIRGFQQFNIFRDGFRDERIVVQETATIERIEVLKGPASVLFGNLEPGGIINIISERPLSDPHYILDLQAGNFGLVRPQLDFTGPLNDDKTVLYRLNTVYERGDGFRNFDQDIQRFFISPVLSWDISDQTNLLVEFEYSYDKRPFDRGIVAIGDRVANIPRDRILGEPDDFLENKSYSIGYRLEHEFNDNWQIRNAFRFSSADTLDVKADPRFRLEDETTGELRRFFRSNDDIRQLFEFQTSVLGNFLTGSIEHEVAVGIDYFRNFSQGTNSEFPTTPSINIFDPVYKVIPQPNLDQFTDVIRDSRRETDTVGIYLQDLISFTDNLKLLLGGRFDFSNQNELSFGSPSSRYDEAFNPRVGVVYQPIEPLSLYGSFSRSFAPNFGTTSDGETLEPERGTQYEIGARAELLDGRLITNLAFYNLTKVNIADSDPNDPTFTFFVPIGEQRSRGIELDVAGEILPGWNLIASYAYTDAEITKGTFGVPDGSRPANVPEHSGSIWTTYEIQTGDLQGLGFGLGLFFVGERQGDNQNTFRLPGYVRTDVAIYYERDNWRAGLNIRNLFDTNYFESVEFGRVTVKPGAPFTIIGSISVKF